MTDISQLHECVRDVTDKIQQNEDLIKSYHSDFMLPEDHEEVNLIKQECRKLADLRHIYMQRIRVKEYGFD